MERSFVDLPTYRVTIASGALDELGDAVRASAAAHRYAIITDSNVAPLYGERVRSALGESSARVYTIPAGEAFKTREIWGALTDSLLADGVGRDSAVVALGGGVVGDLAGFVAATYMRGIPFVQVPTTLLAMIDASIGGKTGLDTPAGKNLVGAFHQPAAVVVDPSVLRSLPLAHLRAGLAEAIKHGVIADAAYFEFVSSTARDLRDGPPGDLLPLTRIIQRSVAIKADVVWRDEREGGVRKTLNFGHTIGHAIELCSDYRMLHGESVAVGMVLESEVAERLGIAEVGTASRIRTAVESAGLPADRPTDMGPGEILAATRSDKKARGGVVEYALPARVGAMAAADRGWSIPVPDAAVMEVLQ